MTASAAFPAFAQPADHQSLALMLSALQRFARSRVRNPALAEDALSETLLAVLEPARSPRTAAQGKSGVYGIRRHKQADQLRQQGRETPAGDMLYQGEPAESGWAGDGAWTGGRNVWSEPEGACSHTPLLAPLSDCCDGPPSMQRWAFVMRELGGEEPALLCLQRAVSDGHLWVLVHRARQRLQALLKHHWVLSPGLAKAATGHSASASARRAAVNAGRAPRS